MSTHVWSNLPNLRNQDPKSPLDRRWRSDTPVIALRLGEVFDGRPVVANNILDGAGQAFFHDSSYQNRTPAATDDFVGNDGVPRGQARLAHVYMIGELCYATASELDAR